jgi:Legionella pneumophila major outer membrane protein precursor
MKHVFYSLLAISPLLLQAERADPDYEHIYLDEEECMLEDIVEEAWAEAQDEAAQAPIASFAATNDSVKDLSQNNKQTYQAPMNHIGVFAFGEFLWWKLNETDLDYATHKTFATNPRETSTALSLGHVHTVDIDWNPGFRVGLGYQFSKDLWELSGIYTYFYTKGDDDVTCGECHFNDPSLPSFIDTTVASNLDAVIEAKANLHFWYHIGDIELAKPIIMGKYTSCRFIVGPTMAFIQQKFHTTSIDNMNTFTPCPAEQTKTKMDWQYKGGGIKLGIDSRWNVFNGINFIFGGHFSALYGYYINKWHAHRFLDPVSLVCPPGTELEKNKFSDATIKDRRNIFGTRIFGGIGYDFKWKCLNAEIYANFELNTWFNLTDQYRMAGESLIADNIRGLTQVPLNLAGIDVGLKINF